MKGLVGRRRALKKGAGRGAGIIEKKGLEEGEKKRGGPLSRRQGRWARLGAWRGP